MHTDEQPAQQDENDQGQYDKLLLHFCGLFSSRISCQSDTANEIKGNKIKNKGNLQFNFLSSL